MIYKNLSDIVGTEREVNTENWTSLRVLLRADGLGFSLHQTTVVAGSQTTMQYKNHVEAVYCIEGEGEVELAETGATYQIVPGTMYALNQHEKHILRAREQMRLVCVFNPPLRGREVHDIDGSYPLLEEDLTVIGHL